MGPGLRHQTDQALILALPHCSVTLGKSHNLSELPFPQHKDSLHPVSHKCYPTEQ